MNKKLPDFTAWLYGPIGAAEAEVLMVSLFVRTVTDQTRAKFDGLSAGACAGPDGSFGPLRKAPRFVRRAMPKPSDAASADADPR